MMSQAASRTSSGRHQTGSSRRRAGTAGAEEYALDELGGPGVTAECKGLKGLIAAGAEVMKMDGEPMVKDVS
jgi:hypothetical protein